MDISLTDLNLKICRICLEDIREVSVPLFIKYEDKAVAELIEICSSIQVSLTDPYPQIICGECFNELKFALQFRRKCEEADYRLRNGILTSFIKTEAEPMSILQDSDLLKLYPECNSYDAVKLESIETLSEEAINDEIISKLRKRHDGKKSKMKKVKRKAEHLDSESYPCTICKKVVKTRTSFYQHLKNHENKGDNPLDECSSCKKKFYFPDSYLKHKCPIKPICYLCNIEFSLRTEVYKHIEEVHCKNGSYVCEQPDCKSVFTSTDGIFFHNLSHFNPITEICSLCGRIFHDPRAFYRHGKIHKQRIQYNCDLCGQNIWRKSNLFRHMKTVHLHKKYFCDVCNANFSETMSLKLHKIKIHNLEPKFKCQECNTGFVYQSQLKLHEKGHLTGKQFRVREKNEIVDRGKRAWECTTCLKTFSMKANYKRHLKTVHLQIRQFSCNLCDKKFTQKSVLETHARIHSGLRPFECQYCMARYSDRSTLYKHLKNIHKEEKPATKVSVDYNKQ